MRLSRLGLVVAFFSPLLLGAGDFACVIDPPPDSIVISSPVRISGLLLDDQLVRVNGEVQLQVNGAALPWVQTTSSEWTYPSVALPVGPSIFTGSTRRPSPQGQILGNVSGFRLERRTDLARRGRQDVFPFFLGNVDQVLREMAIATLEPDPTPAELDALGPAVRSGVVEYLKAVYAGTNVNFLSSPPAGEATGIQFDTTFARAPHVSTVDYTNTTKMEKLLVAIRPMRDRVIDLVNRNQFFVQTPARPTDTPAQRARQLALLIGSEGAHNLGHALGLVAEGPTFLNGCRVNHGCPTFDADNPFANRFDNGHLIMDPPELSPLFARLGFTSATDATERMPIFSNYDMSYLRIVTAEP